MVNSIMLDLAFHTIIISLAELTKKPKEYFCEYVGQPEPVKCHPVDFCANNDVLSYEPNMKLSDSYYNWISTFGLECASAYEIGMITTSFFIGWVVAIPVITRLADTFSRVRLIQFGAACQVLNFLVLLNGTSYEALVTFMVIQGLLRSIFAFVNAMFIYESFIRSHYTIGSMTNVLTGSVFAILSILYFIYISKSADGMIYGCAILSAIGTIGAFFYSEPPRYLIKKQEFKQA